MIYDHIVKHNGKYYAAGEEVPENIESLPAVNFSEIDDDIALETDAPMSEKTQSRRGRPKKIE